MKHSRRSFVSMAALVATSIATHARAQSGGREPAAHASDADPRIGVQALVDPVVSIERELPSLRSDLALSAEQIPLFDRFERDIRAAAEDGRVRARHVSVLRADGGKSMKAEKVLGTIAADDTQRAEASRRALARMKTLRAALRIDQQRRFDQRIVQSLREQIGTS